MSPQFRVALDNQGDQVTVRHHVAGKMASMTIREIHIRAYNDDDTDTLCEPPERLINLAVSGEVAFLQIQRVDKNTGQADPGEAEATVEVPAKSLLRALQVLIDDNDNMRPQA